VRQEARERRNHVKVIIHKSFCRVPCGPSPPGKVDQPPEASVAWGLSNHHCEAYTASLNALLLNLEISVIAEASSVVAQGATSHVLYWSEAAVPPGSLEQGEQAIEDSRELERS